MISITILISLGFLLPFNITSAHLTNLESLQILHEGTLLILFQASIISRLPYAMGNPPLVPGLNALYKFGQVFRVCHFAFLLSPFLNFYPGSGTRFCLHATYSIVAIAPLTLEVRVSPAVQPEIVPV
jgi:hypothetical protein